MHKILKLVSKVYFVLPENISITAKSETRTSECKYWDQILTSIRILITVRSKKDINWLKDCILKPLCFIFTHEANGFNLKRLEINEDAR